MTRRPEPLRISVVKGRAARVMEMIKLLITDGAEIPARSRDGKDTDTAR